MKETEITRASAARAAIACSRRLSDALCNAISDDNTLDLLAALIWYDKETLASDTHLLAALLDSIREEPV